MVLDCQYCNKRDLIWFDLIIIPLFKPNMFLSTGGALQYAKVSIFPTSFFLTAALMNTLSVHMHLVHLMFTVFTSLKWVKLEHINCFPWLREITTFINFYTQNNLVLFDTMLFGKGRSYLSSSVIHPFHVYVVTYLSHISRSTWAQMGCLWPRQGWRRTYWIQKWSDTTHLHKF